MSDEFFHWGFYEEEDANSCKFLQKYNIFLISNAWSTQLFPTANITEKPVHNHFHQHSRITFKSHISLKKLWMFSDTELTKQAKWANRYIFNNLLSSKGRDILYLYDKSAPCVFVDPHIWNIQIPYLGWNLVYLLVIFLYFDRWIRFRNSHRSFVEK